MINIKLFGNSKVYKDHLKYFFHVLLLMSILTITKRGKKMDLILNSLMLHFLVFGFGIFISFVIFTMIIFPIYLKLYRGK